MNRTIRRVGKNNHHQPAEQFCVDVAEDKISRHPSQLAAATRKFLKLARAQGRPFFHNVNCYDPHRPFIGINGPNDLAGGEPPSRWIQPGEITQVPGFLEDLPEIRRELAGYYTNVRRLDDALGAVLKVLMRRTGDPFTEAFAHRDRKDLVPAVLEKLNQEYCEKPERQQTQDEQ